MMLDLKDSTTGMGSNDGDQFDRYPSEWQFAKEHHSLVFQEMGPVFFKSSENRGPLCSSDFIFSFVFAPIIPVRFSFLS